MRGVLLVIAGCLAWPALASQPDADAAQSLARKSNCFKCHAMDKKKSGPPYKKIAEKYRGKSDAEEKLFTHLTTHPEIEVDGEKEQHASLKTTDEAQVRNVVRWVLTR